MPDTSPVLRAVDAVTVPVPDLDAGLDFYRDRLGQQLIWRIDELGQAGLRLPGGDSELVLSTRQPYEPNWLVTSVDDAADDVRFAGGTVLVEPFDSPVRTSPPIADPLTSRQGLSALSGPFSLHACHSTDRAPAALDGSGPSLLRSFERHIRCPHCSTE